MSQKRSEGLPWVWNAYPYHPCMVYLYTYIWLIFIANVGKYTSPMDAIGKFALCSPRHVSRTCEKKTQRRRISPLNTMAHPKLGTKVMYDSSSGVRREMYVYAMRVDGTVLPPKPVSTCIWKGFPEDLRMTSDMMDRLGRNVAVHLVQWVGAWEEISARICKILLAWLHSWSTCRREARVFLRRSKVTMGFITMKNYHLGNMFLYILCFFFFLPS